MGDKNGAFFAHSLIILYLCTRLFFRHKRTRRRIRPLTPMRTRGASHKSINSNTTSDMKLSNTLLLLLCTLLTLPTMAKSKSEQSGETHVKTVTIYGFGIAQNLADTVAYISPVAAINGAKLLKKDCLQNHQYYTEQFKNYLDSTYNTTHLTTAFFFSKSKKQMEKKLTKVQKLLQKRTMHNITVITVPYEAFHFKVPVIVEAKDEDF